MAENETITQATPPADLPVGQGENGTGQSTESPIGSEESVEDVFNGGKFDPKTLPKEVLPVYKGMQAAYTKKTQEIADLRKELEGMKKSQLANSMTSEEGIEEAVNDTLPPQETTSQTDEEKWLRQQITTIASEIADKRIAEFRQQINPVIMDNVDTKIEKFKQTYPDLMDYSTEMAPLVEAGVPLEKAYWAIKGPKAEEIGRKNAFAEMQTKQKSQTIQPGPSTDTVGTGGKMGFDEAFAAAKRSAGKRV